MNATARQLTLGIRLRDSARFDSFLPGPNAEPLAALRALAEGQGESPLYCWGPAGSGRSHLLQAACQHAGARGRGAAYLPLAEHAALDPAMLEGLEAMPLVCLDDVQAVAGEAHWEEGLFHLFNRIRERGGALAVAADRAPAALPLALPDLRSRLEWGLVYALAPLDDAQRLAALQLRARRRGFELPDDTGRYLMRRVPRDMPALFELLDRLDEASLAAQRRLTVPFVKGVLGEKQI